MHSALPRNRISEQFSSLALVVAVGARLSCYRMNKRLKGLEHNSKIYFQSLVTDLAESRTALQEFCDDPEQRDETGDLKQGSISLVKDLVLLLRDCLRRCVSNWALTVENTSALENAFELLDSLKLLRLEESLIMDYKSLQLGTDKQMVKTTSCFKNCELWPTYFDLSYRHEWSGFATYYEGDLVFILNEDGQRSWFRALKSVPWKICKCPVIGTDSEFWKCEGRRRSDLDADMLWSVCSLFGIQMVEFFDLVHRLVPRPERNEKVEEEGFTTGNIFATVLMVSAAYTFIPNQTKKDVHPVSHEKISRTIDWLKRGPQGSVKQAFTMVDSMLRYWPPYIDVKERVELVILYGGEEANGWFDKGKICFKKFMSTCISITHPINSILIYLQCWFDMEYDFFSQPFCDLPIQIFTVDQHENLYFIKNECMTANQTFSRALKKSQRDGHTQILLRIVDRDVKRRDCLRYHFRVDRTNVDGLVMSAPVGVSLQQIRQLMADFVMEKKEDQSVEIQHQDELSKIHSYFFDMICSDEYYFIDRGDEVEKVDEVRLSAAKYAVDQGCLDMFGGEQGTRLVLNIVASESHFYTTEYLESMELEAMPPPQVEIDFAKLAREETEKEAKIRAAQKTKEKKEAKLAAKRERLSKAILLGTRQTRAELDILTVRELEEIYEVIKNAVIEDD